MEGLIALWARPFRSPLLGRFNLMNLLQAVGVLLQQQLPLPVLLEAIGVSAVCPAGWSA